jgi:hypothetical protein
MERTSAKIALRLGAEKKEKRPLDRFSGKARRGRPLKIQPSWVVGRADNYRIVFGQIWKHIWPGLSKAQTREDVIRSFSDAGAVAYAREFVIAADAMLQVVRDPRFPKRKREAQINFLADSIAGYDDVTPRRSRDICQSERARMKKAHRILCYEFYIECSCGYQGHSRNHACPICQAPILFNPRLRF